MEESLEYEIVCPKCDSNFIMEDFECTESCEENDIECDCPGYVCTECGHRF